MFSVVLPIKGFHKLLFQVPDGSSSEAREVSGDHFLVSLTSSFDTSGIIRIWTSPSRSCVTPVLRNLFGRGMIWFWLPGEQGSNAEKRHLVRLLFLLELAREG